MGDTVGDGIEQCRRFGNRKAVNDCVSVSDPADGLAPCGPFPSIDLGINAHCFPPRQASGIDVFPRNRAWGFSSIFGLMLQLFVNPSAMPQGQENRPGRLCLKQTGIVFDLFSPF
jgi:hypothetical protein